MRRPGPQGKRIQEAARSAHTWYAGVTGPGYKHPGGDAGVAEAILLGIGAIGVVFFLVSPPWFGHQEGGSNDQ